MGCHCGNYWGAKIPVCEGRQMKTCFLFPGQGAQYPGMGRDLYEHEPEFRTQVDECCSALPPNIGSDPRDLLDRGLPKANLNVESSAHRNGQHRPHSSTLFEMSFGSRFFCG